MKLTEKGKQAFDLACEYFANGAFSAADLSAKSGEKIAAASLSALEKKGLLEKFATKPVTFRLIEGAKELVESEGEVKKGPDNNGLINAKKQKNDEFYTRFEDIEAEVSKYKKYFKNKVVYLNCDDKETSQFWKFFELNFEEYKLKKLISTHYDAEKPTYKLELSADIDGDGKITKGDIVKTPLKQNGDFRSEESINLLKESDIVVTNPPFSLFKEYIVQLMKYKKKFLVIGNQNAITYKEIFPLIRDEKIWLGNRKMSPWEFRVPKSTTKYKRIDDNGEKYDTLGLAC